MLPRPASVGKTVVTRAKNGMKTDIEMLKTENAQREKDIAAIKAEAVATNAGMQGKIDGLVQVQRQEVGKLRDDMQQWFMALDQKLADDLPAPRSQ